jgi:hypothetical protein
MKRFLDARKLPQLAFAGGRDYQGKRTVGNR